MKRVDSVISLIYSLSKSEKKHFSLQVIKDKEEKDYLVIYDIIIKSKQPNGNTVKEEFYRRKPNGSFEVSIQYLYEKLTDTLLTLRKKKDIYYDLLNNLCKARMLYERSLFEECFEILSNTIEQAQFYENNEILTIALKLELEYLLRLNFPNMTEQELFHKHFIQNEALKKIRKITEQSSLHNLLKYRLSHIGSIRTVKQKQDMNDLMVNELYIAASSDSEGNFELTRNHKLFQANYLMGAGDYRAALNSYKELDSLFEQNQQFFCHAPLFSHLLHQHLNFFSDLFINLIQMLRQFPGQYQILIPGTPVLLQKLFSHYSIFSICKFFFIDFQIRQIIISMQCVC